MKILVANLGSTSFKYRLFDMPQEDQLARGGVDRIGDQKSVCSMEIDGRQYHTQAHLPNHATAVRQCLTQLTDSETGCLQDSGDVAAIGLKAVHGGRISGVQSVTSEVLNAMEEVAQVAPAHNPPYLAAMRILQEKLPEIPLVAAFETDFHATISPRLRHYAVPHAWAETCLVKRWGFHGASHRFIGQRAAQILHRDNLRLISCHLGGSSSLCAMRGGHSVATSMGMSPQTGLPQNNRTGDFDPFALPLIMKQTGKSLTSVLEDLSQRSGLLGLSGLSGDIRDLAQAADSGNRRARLAIEVYTTAIRHHLGASLVELGMADAIVFTGGIGENHSRIRSAVCDQLEPLGIVLDSDANNAVENETKISDAASRVQIWVIPTNEEIIVARQVNTHLEG